MCCIVSLGFIRACAVSGIFWVGSLGSAIVHMKYGRVEIKTHWVVHYLTC